MFNIGTSPGNSAASAFEVGSLTLQATVLAARPVTSAIASSAAALITSTALDPGAVPVDQARVATIKKAIETNSYPLTPARIGDAMIAAGMLLRMPK